MPFDNTFEQELKNYLQTNYTFYTVFSKNISFWGNTMLTYAVIFIIVGFFLGIIVNPNLPFGCIYTLVLAGLLFRAFGQLQPFLN